MPKPLILMLIVLFILPAAVLALGWFVREKLENSSGRPRKATVIALSAASVTTALNEAFLFHGITSGGLAFQGPPKTAWLLANWVGVFLWLIAIVSAFLGTKRILLPLLIWAALMVFCDYAVTSLFIY